MDTTNNNTNQKTVNDRIRLYLAKQGKMSGRDICDDLGVDEIDVQQAAQDGVIKQTTPVPGGGGTWYRLC